MVSPMAHDEEFQRRIDKAVSEGDMPTLDENDADGNLFGLATAQNEACTSFERAGFTRGESLYLTASMFAGNPGRPPKN